MVKSASLDASEPHIGRNGHLWIEECDTIDLTSRFGTPLYAVSEAMIRSNVRRFRSAFEERHPHVEILFANKVFNNLAIRHLMNDEGVGGDCFGETELYLSLLAGTLVERIVLNGSSKSNTELDMAIEAGVSIVLDTPEDLDRVAERCPASKTLRLGVRAKLSLASLGTNAKALRHFGPGSLSEQSLDNKWGVSLDELVVLATRISADPRFELHELHYHLGRVTTDVRAFACVAHELVEWAAKVCEKTGVVVPTLNLGGGWAVGRDEGHGPGGVDDASTPSFDAYADAVCTALKSACANHGFPLPTLRLEPGRALVANAVVLLSTVGVVKRHSTKTWVSVDASTNHAPRIRTSDWYHHMLVANRPAASPDGIVDIVGPLCVLDVLGRQRALPRVERGDVIALLDAGAYTESAAANFNGQPRPASVLIHGPNADLITVRETPSDVIRRYQVPLHLLVRQGTTDGADLHREIEPTTGGHRDSRRRHLGGED